MTYILSLPSSSALPLPPLSTSFLLVGAPSLPCSSAPRYIRLQARWISPLAVAHSLTERSSVATPCLLLVGSGLRMRWPAAATTQLSYPQQTLRVPFSPDLALGGGGRRQRCNSTEPPPAATQRPHLAESSIGRRWQQQTHAARVSSKVR
uniref:Uncharacterized protein n=1 Tax=Oryza meridionalis TaxID=40149 RepID=A0A0E0ELP7_9ORYZ